MHRMTGKAIGHGLALGMRLVTLEALGNLSVLLVAEITGLLSMLARELLELLALLFMAGQTGSHQIAGKYDAERIVRIDVAPQAVFQLIMRLALMAHGALGDDLLAPGAMLQVAFKTRYRSLVLALVGRNGGGLLLVALHAVSDGKLRPGRLCRHGQTDHDHCRENSRPKNLAQ